MSIRIAARAARTRRRSRGGTALAASGSALAVSLLLAGCASAPDGPPAPPFDAVALPAEAPTALPDQRVAPGEVVALASADAAGVDGPVVATSVLGVAEGQPAYWSGYEDGARFADRIPYFAFVQTRWLEGERGPANGPVLRPFLADGTEVDIIQRQVGGVSASAQCPYEMPVLRADDGHAAEEHLECVVYAVPVGQELAELRWHDVPRTVLETPDPATHPFLAAPVVWEVDALPAAAAKAGG
ncbi:hypothetical protein EOG37_09575 [Clavibacter michiganensis subsp. michiganensis]|uniref:hypothetical protein n=1 Tax=Clavibacter michiganensis TaxID=28447 RepID=UPI0013651B0B|nr:hypothetical protein [Clavibacter michiganensis]MBW8026930.1 hypothetical protein [Clavibacter michiganensis subsp. michiganensis]MWJ15859.1 hypothetical protein [Clavibacter michiganensis subsp. michiganensis]